MRNLSLAQLFAKGLEQSIREQQGTVTTVFWGILVIAFSNLAVAEKMYGVEDIPDSQVIEDKEAWLDEWRKKLNE